MIKINFAIGFFCLGIALAGCRPGYDVREKGDYIFVSHNGPTLGFAKTSGVQLLTEDGLPFKDMNKNGKLDDYEDWRLPAEERATYLAKRMTVGQIAGLMLHTDQQYIPYRKRGRYKPTYNGKLYDESGASAGDLTDDQKSLITETHLRHFVISTVESPAAAAEWNNNAQALAESLELGIPVNSSTNPRHTGYAGAEYDVEAGGDISLWPAMLGLAATFNPELVKKFGKIASVEYRAMGITTALSPQIDLATDPRWGRFKGTLGEDPALATDLARAYIDGFQTSTGEFEIAGGWGFHSVLAMAKHWPGGGSGEGGRDGHFGYGAYAVYPGNNLKDHLKPFTEGAFRLDGPTGSAAAVMPYYTISHNRDTAYGENVANNFNKYIIIDLLREKYGYEGVVCTDWGVTANVKGINIFGGKSWGVEDLTVAERHYKALQAGVDQFGGNIEIEPLIEAYKMGVAKHGEPAMRARFEQSAVRLLRNIFRLGLFENPYLDPEESEKIVGNPEFMKAGYDAQLRSIVMLKNQKDVLPLQKRAKVYIPKRYLPKRKNWTGMSTLPEKWETPFNLKIVDKYFQVVEHPEDADFALVGIQSPNGGPGYSSDDVKVGGNGYMPISLQYGKYTAKFSRDPSIAGGSPLENFTNRSYRGKTVTTVNAYDMKMVNETKAKMGDKPVVVVVHLAKPMVFAEIEKPASAILIHMGVQDQAIMDILSGKAEPSALLPFRMPADMKTVEDQFEDVPRDMKCYVDSEGNVYDFAFGLNWSGRIKDERYEKYY